MFSRPAGGISTKWCEQVSSASAYKLGTGLPPLSSFLFLSCKVDEVIDKVAHRGPYVAICKVEQSGVEQSGAPAQNGADESSSTTYGVVE